MKEHNSKQELPVLTLYVKCYAVNMCVITLVKGMLSISHTKFKTK